jgi:zinc protease
MSRLSHLAAIAGGLSVGLSALWAGAAPAQSIPGWPQSASDLAADPAVRFGTLPNGMRYAVMRNATPAHQISLRLRIGSGSLEESDAEQGLAHVLEHMAFKGSAHVPAGEMVKILQREGLAFGPDTNAETEWTQTVYMLDLPRDDDESLDTGLMLMRETAGELTLDAAALATERGVVLSEERLRDTPLFRAQKSQIDLFAHGQLAAERFPIGLVDVVKNAPVSLVRTFYEANYRPDRATVIAAGDFDPAVVEAKIRARFSDWTPVGPPTAEPNLGHVEPRGLTVKLVHLPGSSTQTVIAWARPYDASPDTAAKERREVMENLGIAVLNRRLDRLARSEHPPFIRAGASFQNLFHSDKIAVVEAVSTPDGWRASVDAAEEEVRRLVDFGVGARELDREVTETRASLRNAVAGAATRLTPTLASGLVDAVDENEVFTAPSTDLALFEEAVKSLKAASVNSAARAVFAGAGPLVELATPDPIDGGEAALAAEFSKAQSASLSPPAEEAAIAWPYERIGAPGKLIQRTVVADLGLVTARFANGVSLTVKPTSFRQDQVLVSVNVGAGRLDFPRDRPTVSWAVAALVAGGFGKIDFEDSQRALAGKVHAVEFAVQDDAFLLGGATRPEDLRTQLQVMAAYLADPGYQPEAFERLRGAYLAQLPQLEATPSGVFERDSGALLASGDPRFAFPTRQQLLAAKPQDLKALLSGPLSRGPVEVTIVGDITADQAIALTAETLGALPTRARNVAPRPDALTVRFPVPTPVPLAHTDTGRPDQAVGVVAWPMTGFYPNMAASRAAMLASDVLENRLLDQVRIAQGDTYSPETRVDLSQTFPDYGYTYSAVEMPPGKIAAFFASVSAITADLRAKPISADELVRVKNPKIATLRRAQATNEYWLADLTGSLADPRRLDLIRSTFPDYEKITPADIQAAARRWLVDEKAWRLIVRAASQPPTVPSAPS